MVEGEVSIFTASVFFSVGTFEVEGGKQKLKLRHCSEREQNCDFMKQKSSTGTSALQGNYTEVASFVLSKLF